MMNERAAWKLLGIEPCSDERAVKRAYAAKLKQIDPDSDIQGFTRLRDALQTARYDARYRKEREEHPERFVYEDEDDDLYFEENDVGDEPIVSDVGVDLSAVDFTAFGNALDGSDLNVRMDTGEGPASLSLPEEEFDEAFGGPERKDPLDEHFRSLGEALSKTPFISKHDRQARDAVRAILADPRMDGIEFAENVESWLANILVDAIPKSDGAIEEAEAHFGWRRETGRATPRWHVADVAQRADDIACMRALDDPEHRWHEAYEALRFGSPKQYSLGTRARLQPLVVELVESLRQYNPAIERQLHPEAVDRWMELGHVGLAPELVKSEGISWFGWMVMILFVVQIARSALAFISGAV